MRENLMNENMPGIKIALEAENISSRERMADFMKSIFDFPDYFGGGLDALNDMLSEIYLDTEFCISKESLRKILDEPYAYRTLVVISAAAADNRHISVRFLP